MTSLLSTLLASLISVFTVASAQPYIDARLPVDYASVGIPVTPIVTMDRVYELSSDTAIVPTSVERPGPDGVGTLYSGENFGVVRTGDQWILRVRSTNANGYGPWLDSLNLTEALSSGWTAANVNDLFYNLFRDQAPSSTYGSLGAMLGKLINIDNSLQTSNATSTTVFDWSLSGGFTSTGRLNTYNVPGIINHVNTLMARLANMQQAVFYTPGTYEALSSSGERVTAPANLGLSGILGRLVTTTVGMNTNLENALVGGHGNTYTMTTWVFGDDDSVLTKSEQEVIYSNLLEALVGIGQQLQQPLSQLQAVLANDDELELRQQTEPEVDAVIDGFTGEGQGAPSVSQIGDIANVSGDMSSLFDSGVGVDDFFTAMTTGDAFEFFSQETANDLDTTNAPVMYSVQDDFEGLVQDSDGFYSLVDFSFFDLSLFLGKGG